MTDPGLEKLFAELEATFDASIAREEEDAAADLGFALAQTNKLQHILPRLPHGVVLIDNGVSIPVAQIGTDYVLTHPPVRMIPLDRSVMRSTESGSPPSATDASMVLTLRRLARSRALVEIDCADGDRHSGLMLSVGDDHLVLRKVAGQLFVSLQAVRSIRLLCDPRSLGL